MNRIKKRLFVLDSSFNPPHFGHLQLLSGLPNGVLLFSTKNVDKRTRDFDHQIEMIKLLSLPSMITDRARFIDKVELFDTPVTFLMGYDTLIRFFDPKYYDSMEQSLDQFFTKARIRMIDRGNFDVPVWERKELRGALKWKEFVDIAEKVDPISSTQCRNAVKEYYQGLKTRHDLETLMPVRIVDYILQHKLYS